MTDANGQAIMINNEWNEFNGMGTTIPARKFNPSYYLGQGAKSSSNYIYRDNFTTQRQTWNVNTTYALNLAQHHFNFMVGMQSLSYIYDGVWGKKTVLMDPKNPQFDLATGTQTTGGSFNWNSTLGFFGRLNYNYKEKYLLSASIRREGSSRFGANHKWGLFPALSAGWRVSGEDFMKDLTWVDDLKVRLGFGVTGNDLGSDLRSVELLSNGRHKTIFVESVTKPATGDENGPNGYNNNYVAGSQGSPYSGPTNPYA
jgi:hypothetical protein